jgi:ACS family hexuronate transporter-like MFS transporter
MKTTTGTYRWRIVTLLFFATTINYIDRSALGILAPDLQKNLGLSESEYSYIVTAFQAAYAIGLLTTGGILDRIGTRLGYTLAMIVWSIAGIFHAAGRGVFSFGIARFTLGLGQSANFPAAIKTITEWFPKKERALATGIFNTGSNLGAIITPIIVPFIALKLNWQWAFIITGALGY